MDLNTASAVMSFYSRLEERIAGFYSDLASDDKYSWGRETFLTFAKECRRQREMVLRAYRETITDAFEAGFSFTALDVSDYEMNLELTEDLSFTDILKTAIDIEDKSYKFCNDVSESSGALLADIAQVFEWVAVRKAKRKQILQSLLDELRVGRQSKKGENL